MLLINKRKVDEGMGFNKHRLLLIPFSNILFSVQSNRELYPLFLSIEDCDCID